LVRENSEAGSLAFVKIDEQNRCQIFNTSYHVSEAIGAGGEGDLIGIFLTLELLYKLHTSSSIDVYGYQLDKAQFEQLSAGNTHPRSLCISASTWWEDIWDGQKYALVLVEISIAVTSTGSYEISSVKENMSVRQQNQAIDVIVTTLV
jgi:hypothetical protein